MKPLNIVTSIAISWVIATAVLARAPPTLKTEGQKSGHMMSMDDMTKQCREHCTKVSKSMDDMTKMMNDAKQSNDINKMRGVLDQMQKPMADMKEHMTMCMKMMSMTQNTGGDVTKKK